MAIFHSFQEAIESGVSFAIAGRKFTLEHTNMTENSKILNLSGTVTDTTKGVRQGAFYAYLERGSSYALTAWDGNPDCVMKLSVRNKAANTTSNGGVRGFDVNSRNHTGSINWVNGGYITAENSTGCSAASLSGLEVNSKNNGTLTGNNITLKLYDESQGYTGTSYAIHIDTTANSPFIRENCIYINSGASCGWTNALSFDGTVTNVMDFAETDGTNGLKVGAACATTSTSDAAVKIDGNGTSYYVPAYTAANTTGSW